MVGKKQDVSGFTIVELVIVMLVIALLATVVFIGYTNTTRQAQNTQPKEEARAVIKDLEAFRTTARAYPASITDCPTPATSSMCLTPKEGFTYEYTKRDVGGANATIITRAGYDLKVLGEDYFFYTSPTTVTGTREFVQYVDLAPLIERYGLKKYRLSFYLKSANTSVETTARVYFQNGSTARHGGLYEPINVTTSFKKYNIDFTPTLSNAAETASILAFYGTYDSGNKMTIEDVSLTLAP